MKHLLLRLPILLIVFGTASIDAQTLDNTAQIRSLALRSFQSLNDVSGPIVRRFVDSLTKVTTPDTTVAIVARQDSAAARKRVVSAGLRTDVHTLATFARDNPASLDSAVIAYQSVPWISRRLGDADSAFRSLAVGTMPKSQIDSLFAAAEPTDTARMRHDINAIRGDVSSAIQRNSSTTTAIVLAEGNLRDVLTGKENAENKGTGTLGVAFLSPHTIWTAKVAIAATRDTVSSQYGSSMLAPGQGRAFSSGILSFYWNHNRNDLYSQWGKRKRNILNVPKLLWAGAPRHIYGFAGSAVWRIPKAPNDTALVARNAVIVGTGLLYGGEVHGGFIAENPVSLKVNFGLAGRFLSGDVSNHSDVLRTSDVLGSKTRAFYGLEGGFGISFNSVTAEIKTYYFYPPNKQHVDGLTRAQVVGGIAVSGELLRGPLQGR